MDVRRVAQSGRAASGGAKSRCVAHRRRGSIAREADAAPCSAVATVAQWFRRRAAMLPQPRRVLAPCRRAEPSRRIRSDAWMLVRITLLRLGARPHRPGALNPSTRPDNAAMGADTAPTPWPDTMDRALLAPKRPVYGRAARPTLPGASCRRVFIKPAAAFVAAAITLRVTRLSCGPATARQTAAPVMTMTPGRSIKAMVLNALLTRCRRQAGPPPFRSACVPRARAWPIVWSLRARTCQGKCRMR